MGKSHCLFFDRPALAAAHARGTLCMPFRAALRATVPISGGLNPLVPSGVVVVAAGRGERIVRINVGAARHYRRLQIFCAGSDFHQQKLVQGRCCDAVLCYFFGGLFKSMFPANRRCPVR